MTDIHIGKWKVDALEVEFTDRSCKVVLEHTEHGSVQNLHGEISDLKPGGDFREYAEQYYRRSVAELIDGEPTIEVARQVQDMAKVLDLPDLQTMIHRIEADKGPK